jgi:hypothetical protein
MRAVGAAPYAADRGPRWFIEARRTTVDTDPNTASGRRRTRSIALVLMLALLAGGVAPAARAQTAPDADGLGGSYESPHYGYTFAWDAPWTVIAETSGSNGDLLWLWRAPLLTAAGVVPPSVISVVGGPAPDLELAACPDLAALSVGAVMGLINPVPAVDALGRPLRAAEPGYAAVAFYATQTVATLVGNAGDVVAVYVECQPLDDGVVLVFSAVTWVASGGWSGPSAGDGVLPNGGLLNCDAEGCLFNNGDISWP